MRIMYFIAAARTGVGGHFWSLRTTVEAMSAHVRCSVMSVGRVEVPALKGVAVPCHHLEWRSPRLWRALREASALFAKEDPEVLHSFDEVGLFFARVLARRHGRALIHTKCGGPNPVGYHPRVGQMILFSKENQDFFSTDPRFRNTACHLIPNRVAPVVQDEQRIARLRAGIPPGDLVFLRIASVGAFHERSIVQTLELVRRLRRDGAPARFLHIGVANSPESLRRIQKGLEPGDRVVTGPEFTLQASALIEAADFVVGTGRSFMEAASRGRVVLAPVSDSPWPVLATPDNFPELLASNFSARSRVVGLEPEVAYQAVLRATESPEDRQRLGAFAREMFDRHFSIQEVVPRYLKLYERLAPEGATRWLDLGRHALRVLRFGARRDRDGAMTGASQPKSETA